jgi:hypothetical protein
VKGLLEVNGAALYDFAWRAGGVLVAVGLLLLMCMAAAAATT